MDTTDYLHEFQKAAALLDQELLKRKNIEVAVGIYLDAVCLKLYKKSWANPSQDPLTAESRIFFSIWINNSELNQHQLFYNVHAFKLNYLKGYSIKSRKFADSFRLSFKQYENKWKNVSTKFGPLTLMQGFIKIDPENFQDSIIELSNNFIAIEHLIDQSLAEFKFL